ncbi:response regulator transcription factor [Bifidobacterium imperatoris]|nr:response regulator transcription factor [Bifidobacterium imperatoris]
MENDSTRHGAIAIALVDNDAMALMALRSLLDRAGFTVIWAAQLGAAAIQRCIREQDRPDVLLVDMALTDMTGVDVCRAVRRWAPHLPLLGMTAYEPAVYAGAALAAGAAAVISKDDIAAIARCIRKLAGQCSPAHPGSEQSAARSFLAPSQSTNTVSATEPALPPDAAEPARSFALSAQQSAIMRLYADGQSTEQIAAKLGISKGTIFSQVARVREKLHARDRDEAVALCRRYLRM